MKNSIKISNIIPFLFSIIFILNVEAKIAKESFFIFDKEKIYLSNFLKEKELIIDLVGPEGYELYGPEGLSIWLDKFKELNYMDLDSHHKMNKNFAPKDEYESPEQIVEKMKAIADRYPEFMKLYTLGTSVENRPILAMKISDNPEIDEVEPEFKFISNMHGNEIVGRELSVRFILDLAEKYLSGNSEITDLINNTEIYIIPSMNPDGNAKRQRGNANWVDLNRDFPDFTTSDNQNDYENRAKETKVIMQFQKSRNFALSANCHDGAVVVNYPWDTDRVRFPQNDLIMKLSKAYAALNSDMVNSSQFQDGVTNGWDWYEVNGGMQDWSYYYHGDMQITLEFSNSKWPRYSEIARQYTLNRDAMLRYLTFVHQGAGFKFDNKSLKGSVHITKIATSGENSKNSEIGSFGFSRGEFYKVLEKGNYKFKIVTNNNKNSIDFTTSVNRSFNQSNGNYRELTEL